MSFHRGDRVTTDRGRGIVEGWKDGSVLVYFGADRQREVRHWVPWTAVTLEPERVMEADSVVWPGTSG